MSIQPSTLQEKIHDRLCDEGQADSPSERSLDGMLIAIQKPHSQAILCRNKEVEFRRTRLRADHPDIALIYETSPTQAIVGAFGIDSVEWLPLDELQTLAQERTPSTKASIADYFEGKQAGTAIVIDEVLSFDSPISLHGADGEWAFTPPQSFQYIDVHDFLNELELNRA